MTFINVLALSRAPGGVGGQDWIVWIGCLGSKGLDLCARGKAWMTRAGDHGRKWGKGWRSWKEGVSESEPWKRGVARLEPWEGGMARAKQWEKER